MPQIQVNTKISTLVIFIIMGVLIFTFAVFAGAKAA
jgi:hypothetical protein